MGAFLSSDSRLFQRLAPRYANDFCPLAGLNRVTLESLSEFLKKTVSRVGFLEKIFERYIGMRLFKDL